MRQAAAFLEDKTALFTEEPHTQVNRSGGRNHPPCPPLPILLYTRLYTGTLIYTHTRTYMHTHSLSTSLQAASREGVNTECINKRKL